MRGIKTNPFLVERELTFSDLSNSFEKWTFAKGIEQWYSNKSRVFFVRNENAEGYRFRQIVKGLDTMNCLKTYGVSDSDKIYQKTFPTIADGIQFIFEKGYYLHPPKPEVFNPQYPYIGDFAVVFDVVPKIVYTIKEAEKSGYVFLHKVVSNWHFYNIQDVAYELNYTLSDLAFFHIGDKNIGVFVRKGATKGYVSEALLPNYTPSVHPLETELLKLKMENK
jgi:hypothetical protein